jgi:hypothetical protein
MNNGLTSVFISVIAIATSALAKTDREKLLAVWIASRDQGVFGSGVVGFDLSEMPWSYETLESDKTFILDAVCAALNKSGWEKLDYEPLEEVTFISLTKFYEMIKAFCREHVMSPTKWQWSFGEPPEGFTLCEKHRVYLHSYGCVLCNDQ